MYYRLEGDSCPSVGQKDGDFLGLSKQGDLTRTGKTLSWVAPSLPMALQNQRGKHSKGGCRELR